MSDYKQNKNVPDLIGKRFGALVVLSECPDRYVSPRGSTSRKYHCKCDCGAEFDIIRTSLTGSRPPRSCKKCSHQRLGKSRGYTKNLQKGVDGAKKSPNSGAFETNVNAKHWVLKAPDGKLYEIDNLANFIRERGDDFPNKISAANSLGHDGKYHNWYVVYKSTERKHEIRRTKA